MIKIFKFIVNIRNQTCVLLKLNERRLVKKFVQVCNKSIEVGVKPILTECFDSIMRNTLKLIVLIVITSELDANKARLF